MKYYMAPMEGMTGYIFRNAYNKYFGDIDKYFTPFITSVGFSHRELNDVLPEHNQGMNVVPQILTNKAEDFLTIAEKLKQMGYTCVNLNLGCPSGTVVSKGRGAGFLGNPQGLDEFLYEIFEKCSVAISIKTRLGISSVEEWEAIMPIYNKYPLEELIIHPRVQKDMYKNDVNTGAFNYAIRESKWPVCYNGDIHSVEDYNRILQVSPDIECIMLGRGIFKNPGLVGELKDGNNVELKKLREFHDEILEGYCEIMSGDRNTLFKMKEIWVYLGEMFKGQDKLLKKLRKSSSVAEFRSVTKEIL